MLADKLILGTANLTTGYGIANPRFMSREKAKELLITAQKLGVKSFDTASAYGASEEFLGDCLPKNSAIKIDSKISVSTGITAEYVLTLIESSISKVKQENLNRVYVHNSEMLLEKEGPEILSGLREAKARGLINSFGASVYDENLLLRIYAKFNDISTFQVPENICDRRLYMSKEILNLNMHGIDFVVRSIFLQGLLLMKSENIPIRMAKFRPSIEQFIKEVNQVGLSRLDCCVAYADSIPWADSILVGAYSSEQLTEICKSNSELEENWQDKIGTFSGEIIDPRLW